MHRAENIRHDIRHRRYVRSVRRIVNKIVRLRSDNRRSYRRRLRSYRHRAVRAFNCYVRGHQRNRHRRRMLGHRRHRHRLRHARADIKHLPQQRRQCHSRRGKLRMQIVGDNRYKQTSARRRRNRERVNILGNFNKHNGGEILRREKRNFIAALQPETAADGNGRQTFNIAAFNKYRVRRAKHRRRQRRKLRSRRQCQQYLRRRRRKRRNAKQRPAPRRRDGYQTRRRRRAVLTQKAVSRADSYVVRRVNQLKREVAAAADAAQCRHHVKRRYPRRNRQTPRRYQPRALRDFRRQCQSERLGARAFVVYHHRRHKRSQTRRQHRQFAAAPAHAQRNIFGKRPVCITARRPPSRCDNNAKRNLAPRAVQLRRNKARRYQRRRQCHNQRLRKRHKHRARIILRARRRATRALFNRRAAPAHAPNLPVAAAENIQRAVKRFAVGEFNNGYLRVRARFPNAAFQFVNIVRLVLKAEGKQRIAVHRRAAVLRKARKV